MGVEGDGFGALTEFHDAFSLFSAFRTYVNDDLFLPSFYSFYVRPAQPFYRLLAVHSLAAVSQPSWDSPSLLSHEALLDLTVIQP